MNTKVIKPKVFANGVTIPGDGLEVKVFKPEWKELKPIKSDLLPVARITPDMLPDGLSGWLVDSSERMGAAPFEYAAVSAIVAASSLIGRKVTIQPKKLDDWEIVPNLWGCCIGRPSAMKTPAIKDSIKALSKMEHEAREQFNNDSESFKAKIKMQAMLEKQAESDAKKLIQKKKFDEAEALLMDNSSDPEPPVCKRFMINDSTIEKLGVILSENPAGLLQFRDELSGWLAGLNREDRQQDRSFWLEAFDGNGSFSYDRITRDDVFMESTTVSVLGGIQPGKLMPILLSQKDGSGDDGLIERFQLMVYPDLPEFKHVDRYPDKAARERAYDAFHSLADIEYEPEKENRPVLKFDSQAQAIFDDWYCSLMVRTRGGSVSANMEGHLGKYKSMMPSLALIFHIIENGAGGSVGVESVNMAIRWCEVLETHANRVYMMADDPLAGAKILAERLDRLPNPFKMYDVKKKDWSGLTDQSARNRALAILEINGHIIKESVSKGRGKPSVNYHINPSVLE